MSAINQGLAERDSRVTVEVKGRDQEEIEVLNKPLHKKNPDVGEKKQVYSSHLIMEQEDASSFGDNEEVSLAMAGYDQLIINAYGELDHGDGLGEFFRHF